jgi:hypothetical protein
MGPDGAPKPRTAVLARTSSNLLTWTRYHSFAFIVVEIIWKEIVLELNECM